MKWELRPTPGAGTGVTMTKWGFLDCATPRQSLDMGTSELRPSGPSALSRMSMYLAWLKEVSTFCKMQNVEKGRPQQSMITQSDQASTNNEEQIQGVLWGYRALGGIFVCWLLAIFICLLTEQLVDAHRKMFEPFPEKTRSAQ